MDKMNLMLLLSIAAIFLLICFFTVFNIMHINYKLKKQEAMIEPKRKIRKRKNTNVYDLKTTRKE
ncbi:MAG: hypothetical protein JXR88_05625 [Clostridia bacterium]|nr:hypothetical protein [Clostridia bacterium]